MLEARKLRADETMKSQKKNIKSSAPLLSNIPSNSRFRISKLPNLQTSTTLYSYFSVFIYFLNFTSLFTSLLKFLSVFFNNHYLIKVCFTIFLFLILSVQLFCLFPISHKYFYLRTQYQVKYGSTIIPSILKITLDKLFNLCYISEIQSN